MKTMAEQKSEHPKMRLNGDGERPASTDTVYASQWRQCKTCLHGEGVNAAGKTAGTAAGHGKSTKSAVQGLV